MSKASKEPFLRYEGECSKCETRDELEFEVNAGEWDEALSVAPSSAKMLCEICGALMEIGILPVRAALKKAPVKP